MFAIAALALVATPVSTGIAIVQRSVVGCLLSAIATGWAIEAAISATTFAQALAFAAIGLGFTAVGGVVWRALQRDH
jgi:hypothetical protein